MGTVARGTLNVFDRRVCMTIPFTTGDCVLALAVRVIKSHTPLTPRWPFQQVGRFNNFLNQHLRDPWPLTQAMWQITGAPIPDLIDGQMPSWRNTTLLPPEASTTIEGWTNRIRCASPPVCPSCIHERPSAIDAYWRIPIMPICLKHEVLLVDRCLACQRSLRTISTQSPSRTLTFFSRGCDNCSTPLPPSQPASSSTIETVSYLREELRQQLTQSPTTERGATDLAAVQDIVNLLHAPGGRAGANKNVYTRSPRTIAAVLPTALALYRGHADPSDHLLHIDNQRVNTYRRGQGGLRRPRVLELLNAPRPVSSRRSRSSQLTEGSHPWPTSLPDRFLLEVTDSLHDAAYHVGLDPDADMLTRWASLIIADAVQHDHQELDHETPPTKTERTKIRRLLTATEQLGTFERLHNQALKAGIAYLRTHDHHTTQRSSQVRSSGAKSA